MYYWDLVEVRIGSCEYIQKKIEYNFKENEKGMLLDIQSSELRWSLVLTSFFLFSAAAAFVTSGINHVEAARWERGRPITVYSPYGAPPPYCYRGACSGLGGGTRGHRGWSHGAFRMM